LARTDTLERIWPPDDWDRRARIPDAAWSTATRLLLSRRGGEEDGFRLNAPPSARIAAEGETRTVRLVPGGPTLRAATAEVDGIVYVDIAGRSVAFRVATPPDVDRAANAAAAAHGTGPVELVAPMPGQVLAIAAPAGTDVEAGDTVVILEAMKMEHAVTAPRAGVVTDIAVRQGEQVTRGQRLAVVEPR
jgi:biotin carboxyl carrier protein